MHNASYVVIGFKYAKSLSTIKSATLYVLFAAANGYNFHNSGNRRMASDTKRTQHIMI
jgi:hypothetical protein